MSDTINQVQATILHRLLECDDLRFSEINTGSLPTDQFSYHLRQLSKAKLIKKADDQTYSLTTDGKLRAIMLHPASNRSINQGFSAVLVIARQRHDDVWQYLLQSRNKVPYQGLISASGDKVYYGETVQAAAERALHLQTGLQGNVTLRSIWHIRDVYLSEIVQDKFFYVHSADQCIGDELQQGLTGKNMWLTLDDLQHSNHAMFNIVDLIRSLETDQLTFNDVSCEVTDY
jgi:ADP-ribose pyrophosphatase YjhB (NUDIX family)